MSDELRPVTWDDFVGQKELVTRLKTHIASAIRRNAFVDHILLSGPPGLGKTSLAHIVANERGHPFTSVVMPVKDTVLRRLVMTFAGVVLFDEIHRGSKKQQEELLTLVEDGYIQLSNGAKLSVEYGFTIIGATTEPEKVIPPLYDRFPIRPTFVEYTDEEMARIVEGMARRTKVEMSHKAAIKLGAATGGVPRNAYSLVMMARDLNTQNPEAILKACGITENGLTVDHLQYLKIMAEACGGAAGIDILSAHLRQPKAFLVNLERLLVKEGLIEYTKQGRSLTAEGWRAAGANILV